MAPSPSWRRAPHCHVRHCHARHGAEPVMVPSPQEDGATAAKAANTSSSRSGRGRATRCTPGRPNEAQSRTTTRWGASAPRSPGRSTRTQLAAVVRTVKPSRASSPANRCPEVGDLAGPGRQLGVLEQWLDEGEGQPVHRPLRLDGADRGRRPLVGSDDVPEPQAGAAPQLRERAEAPDAGITPRPRARGQRVERLVPDAGHLGRAGQAPLGARRVRPPPGCGRVDTSEVAPVERELRVDHGTGAAVLCDEGDGLGSSVGQHQQPGVDADRSCHLRCGLPRDPGSSSMPVSPVG